MFRYCVCCGSTETISGPLCLSFYKCTFCRSKSYRKVNNWDFRRYVVAYHYHDDCQSLLILYEGTYYFKCLPEHSAVGIQFTHPQAYSGWDAVGTLFKVGEYLQTYICEYPAHYNGDFWVILLYLYKMLLDRWFPACLTGIIKDYMYIVNDL